MKNPILNKTFPFIVIFICGCTVSLNHVVKEEREQIVSELTVIEPKPIESPNLESGNNNQLSEHPINRPVITHKADVVFFDQGQSFRDFSENVVSVIDEEDGDIPYEYIGGFVGPLSDEEIYDVTHPKDKPQAFAGRPEGYYFTTGWSQAQNEYGEEFACVTGAFDSEGHASWKEFKIIFLDTDEAAAIGIAHINVEGLNVRNLPSTQGTKMGQVVMDKTYLVYESVEADGYTWYRIARDLWIADLDGKWITEN